MKINKKLMFQIGLAGCLLLLVGPLFGQATNTISSSAATSMPALGLSLGVLASAFATVLGGIGSAWGLGVSGQAATAALSENPNNFGVIFPIQALPGTQGIYGLLIGFLILTRIGVLGGNAAGMTLDRGLYAVFCSLPVGVAGFVSGYWQGVASAAAIQLVSRKPAEFGKAIITPALIETYAVFGLLVSFLMWLKL